MSYDGPLPQVVNAGGTGASTLTGVLVGNGTSAVTASTITQHDLLIGGASNAITSVAPSSTSGVPVISQGSSSNPTFGTAVVAGGGTGSTSFTAYGPVVAASTTTGALTSVTPSSTSGVPLISQGSSSNPAFGTAVVAGGGTGVTTFANTSALVCTGTTSTGALQNVAAVATGQVLTSAGTSTLPAWSSAPSVTSITLSSGSVLNTYVTGSWTPAVNFGGATTGITYTTQIGEYTQIGNVVYVIAYLVLSSVGSATGAATLTGLPVTSRSTIVNNLFMIANNVTATSETGMFAQLGASATSFALYSTIVATGVGTQLTNSNFSSTTSLRIQGFYFSS